jgi:hypothetical protein
LPADGGFFRGRQAVLLTKHGKERFIKPLFEEATGCCVIVESDYDTDLFGTFTRLIGRPGTQEETARLKARKGMELHGADLALASEGSFGPHPVVPFVPLNREIVLLFDAREGLEVCGEYAGTETNYAQTLVSGWEEAERFARQAGFPDHYLIIRPDHELHEAVIKNINTWAGLRDALARSLALSVTGKAYLETDMRAHANPTRMKNIKKAAEDLIRLLGLRCPACGAPGFSVTERKRGLPCEWCGLPTREPAASIYYCQSCNFSREEREPPDTKAPAACCDNCNP